eukprot:1298430-Amphidinium_carterae.1
MEGEAFGPSSDWRMSSTLMRLATGPSCGCIGMLCHMKGGKGIIGSVARDALECTERAAIASSITVLQVPDMFQPHLASHCGEECHWSPSASGTA